MATRLTRKKSNDPIIDSALRDIYKKIENSMSLAPIGSTLPTDVEEGTLTFMQGGNGDTVLAINTQNGWMVDSNSRFELVRNASLKPSRGIEGRTHKPVKGESVKYNKDGNPAISSGDGKNKILLKNSSGVLKIRNGANTDNAEIEAKRVRFVTDDDSTTSPREGNFSYDDSTKTHYSYSRGFIANSLNTGTSGDLSTLMLMSHHADAVIRLRDGATSKWTLGYDKHSGTKFTCGGTSDTVVGDKTITMDDTTPGSDTIAVGMLIAGSGIPVGSVVTAITDGTHIEISENATATANNITATFTPVDDSFKINRGAAVLPTSADFKLDTSGNLTIAGGLTSNGVQTITSTTADQLKVLYDGSNYGLMNVASDGHLEIESVGTDADMTLNAAGTIELNADGGLISFLDDALPMANFGVGRLDVFKSADNYCRTDVSLNGTATISTIGATPANADYIVDAGGDITLDSGTGIFIAKNAGTEFSAANSAYAGMILGATQLYDDNSSPFYATTTSFVNINVTYDDGSGSGSVVHRLKVTFVVPPSNKVKIEVFLPSAQNIDANLFLGLDTDTSGTSLDTDYEQKVWDIDETDVVQIRHHWYINGSDHSWAAGESKTLYCTAKEGIAGGRLYFGDGLANYGGMTMEAIALPATINNGE